MRAITNPLTDKQKKIMYMIDDFINENHYSPSWQELAAMYGCSIKGINDHIMALVKKEFAVYTKSTNRTLRVTNKWTKLRRKIENESK